MCNKDIIAVLETKLRILRDIVTSKNDSNNFSKDVYFKICVCMDTISDSLLGLKDYTSLNHNYGCGGVQYVLLYGFAQCLRLQIQSIIKLYLIIGADIDLSDYFIRSQEFSREILDIILNTNIKCCFISRPSMSNSECDILISLLGEGTKEISKHVDYKEILDRHLEDLNECLEKIILLYS